MRIAFAGTPGFAASALAALLDARYEVCLVLTQPDRPAGRGQQVQPGPVRRLADERRLPVVTPSSLRPGGEGAQAALARLRAAAPEVLVVAAYGLLLPEAVLQAPAGVRIASGRVGAINIHASLLPRWRGAAPIVRAIEAGDRETGITIMQMDAGLDTGPILLAEAIPIDPEATAGTLTAQLAQLGARLVVQALDELGRGTLRARAQPSEGVTYARKVDKREAWVRWTDTAERVAARVRAFDPFPGACSTIGGQTVKIWRARAVAAPAPQLAPGTIRAAGAEGIVIDCGCDSICVTQLQRAGGRRLEAREFLAASPLAAGARWSSPSAPAAMHET